MFASRFSTSRLHIFKSFQRPGERKHLSRTWKSQMKTHKQTNYKATSHPHLLSCSVNHEIQEKLWDFLGQTVIQGALILTTGSAFSRCITLQTNPAVGRSTVLFGLRTSQTAWRYSTVRKEKGSFLVRRVLLSAMTSCNNEEKVDSKTFLGSWERTSIYVNSSFLSMNHSLQTLLVCLPKIRHTATSWLQCEMNQHSHLWVKTRAEF